MTGSRLHTDLSAYIRAGGILKNSDAPLGAFEQRMRGDWQDERDQGD